MNKQVSVSVLASLAAFAFATAAHAQTTNAAPAAPNPDRVASDPRADVRSGSISSISFLAVEQLASPAAADKSCDGGNCAMTKSSGSGGAFTLGYTWKHIGFDLLGGLAVDSSERHYLDKSGAAQAMDVDHFGALAAVRLRGQLQSKYVAGAFAVGPGVVYRVVSKRADNKSLFSVPDQASGAASLALTADLNGQLRITASTSLAVGAMLWIEGSGTDATSDHGDLAIAKGPVSTFMPYVGLHFGP